MTFEEWWKGYWKPTAIGGAFDAAFREAAEAAWEAATAAERERCAKVCEVQRRSWPMDGPATADTIRAAIRAR